MNFTYLTDLLPDHQRLVVCAILNSLAGLLFGYAQCGGINAAAGLLWRCWYHMRAESEKNAVLMGSLFSAVSLTYFPATLFAGYLLDRIGRKKVITWSAAVTLFSTILSVYSHCYSVQFIARLGTGIGMGMLTCSSPIYVSEMVPQNYRGTIGSLFQVCASLGILVGNLQGFLVLGPSRNLEPWLYCSLMNYTSVFNRNSLLMAPAILVSLCLLVLSIAGLPESTSWETTECNASGSCEEGKATTEVQSSGSCRCRGLLQFIVPADWLDVTKHTKILYTGVAMAVAFMLTGINAVMFYAPTFMELGGVEHKMTGSLILMAWNFVTTLVALFLADTVGRRALLLPSLLCMSISVLLMCPIYTLFSNTTFSVAACFILLFVFVAGFEIGPGTLFWVICSEITPQENSAKMFSLINGIQALLSLVVTFSFPALEHVMGSAVFFLFGIPGIAVWVYLYLCLPETKGKAKQEIWEMMRSPKWTIE